MIPNLDRDVKTSLQEIAVKFFSEHPLASVGASEEELGTLRELLSSEQFGKIFK